MKHSLAIRFIFTITISFLYLKNFSNQQDHNRPFQNIITVTVNTKGQARIGKDTFDMQGLSKELQQRFWKSFLGTGKMQDAVKLEYTGDVSANYRTEAINAIKKAQQKALIDLCLQLHKKEFDSLTPRQQEKIKKHYPVLFQKSFE